MNIPAKIKNNNGDTIEIVESDGGFLTLVITQASDSSQMKMQFSAADMGNFANLIQAANNFTRLAFAVAPKS